MKWVLVVIGGELLLGNLISTVAGHGMGGGAWAAINGLAFVCLLGGFLVHIFDEMS